MRAPRVKFLRWVRKKADVRRSRPLISERRSAEAGVCLLPASSRILIPAIASHAI
jgi:hypothetical protein